MEVYIDDILVKNAKEINHIVDMEETFNNLHHRRMKLNPSKYAFGVTASKFLSFMITKHGIKVNLEKIHTILDMQHLISKIEV